MSEDTRRSHGMVGLDQTRSLHPEQVWDRFVDELDRCGQAGSAADVLTPTTLERNAPSSTRFADLKRVDIDNLAKLGGRLGRRGDIVRDIWERTQHKRKPQRSVRHRNATQR
jgi:hypothetical protein